MSVRFRGVIGAATAVVAAAGVLAGCGSSSRSGGSGGKGPVKIGFIQSYSGVGDAFVGDNNHGVAVGLQAVNAGNVAGRKIQIVRADDASDGATATQACLRLINQDHVAAIIGQEISFAQAACNGVAVKIGVPYIYNGPVGVPICTSNYFDVGPTGAEFANPLVDYLVHQKHYHRIYFIGSDDAAPKGLYAQVVNAAKAAGATVIGHQFVPIGTSTYSTELATIAAAKPDAVIEAVVGADAAPFHQQYAAGPTGSIPSADMTLINSLIKVIGPKALNGVYMISPYFPNDPGAANTQFVKQVQSQFGASTEPGTTTVYLYYSMQMVARALKQAGSTSGPALAKALSTMAYSGPAGSWRFEAHHFMGMAMEVGQVQASGDINIVKRTGLLPADQGCH